ncbi:zinc ABC transporter permease subunit ZnuB [Endozoicomonas sp. SM1973]|uniref:High-affinity zinc uptake system membrane protein ZnuB n=1 Tax=Spartinivicinus marinus TaxID=2994442 RepID=A0A853I2Y3_9GAMM|nr:zinc ABC transporter permease subunit ZnuB [Spartinivicinus marinus]MCX4026730.1 zinc ABC transporter permease subunit ZnuB [Spartinivicinus marinus]NYZ64564.1 zinc ABC transporter permease subunit ZnuB [Spartinivicinus marinus]
MVDFFWLLSDALLAGIGVAIVAGPLGSFIVWRRMAYFGDTLAHSALLGVALGFLLQVNLTLAVIIVCLLLAILLVSLQQKQMIASDTLLGILAHTSLSLGLVTISLMDSTEISDNLMGYLFGELLAATKTDIVWIIAGGALVLVVLYLLWKPFLAITVDEDLAKVEGLPVAWLRLALMLLIALVIAVAMKIVGMLLITSLMIIPAATAQRFAKTPEWMAVGASLIGSLAVFSGLLVSYHWDTQTSPTIVVCAGALFLLAAIMPTLSQLFKKSLKRVE